MRLPMSCACENRRMSQEYERMRRLAKAWAKLEDKAAALYLEPDGIYGFSDASEDNTDKRIIEIVSPY